MHTGHQRAASRASGQNPILAQKNAFVAHKLWALVYSAVKWQAVTHAEALTNTGAYDPRLGWRMNE